MPKFNKSEGELVTMFDKWLFVLRNLSRLMERPAALQERIFTKLFEQAEIARFTPQDAREYEESIKVFRDLTNVVNTAERKGREQGREEERIATALRMKADGLTPELIAKYTGLTIAMINDITR